MSTILHIEDEMFIAAAMAVAANEKGHTILYAGNLSTALRMIEQETYDAVITDLSFPGTLMQPEDKAGRQTYAAVRRRHPTMPMVLQTGASFGEVIRLFRAMDTPFNPTDYVGKDQMAFTELIDKLLATKR